MKRLFIVFAAIMTVGSTLTGCRKEKEVGHVGTIERDTILGVPCCVYLPCEYAERAEEEVFPVLYLQHGMFGNEDDWVTKGNIVRIMDSLLRLEQIKEMVVIMPDNCPSRPTYEEEKTNAMTGEWESHFVQFMSEAEHRYSISSLPSQRAIAGLSMGGFHTMHISHFLHGQFAYIGLFSPATIPAPSHEAYDNWKEEVHAMMTSDPVYWIGIGREDFLYTFVTEYRHWLQANHLEYTYYESDGGHDWPNWQDYLCRFLKKIR